MKKIFIILLLFVLSGCSLDGLVVFGEINKVHVVQNSSYVKHYRAYFQRTHLKPIHHGKKYLYFYNKRSKDLAILLHPKNKYILYSFSHPGVTIKIRSDRKHGYYHMLKLLRHKGYRITSPHSVGYTAQLSLRRYKKVKTYRVDVRNYRQLLSVYKKAIRTYNAKEIRNIKTKLPKVLIAPYYKKYKAQATTWEQFRALKIIADKLHLEEPATKKEPVMQEEAEEEEDVETPVDITKEEHAAKSYEYYLQKAPYAELNSYLSSPESKNTLSYVQYNMLQKRNNHLKEKELLKNGSLEELITAYKKNKNPKYKSKIMQRIKEIQED
jgi:hypothetical protein